eukprot:scaffold207_cov409-Prasinococcus_capsulatus_cf.AAC.57
MYYRVTVRGPLGGELEDEAGECRQPGNEPCSVGFRAGKVRASRRRTYAVAAALGSGHRIGRFAAPRRDVPLCTRSSAIVSAVSLPFSAVSTWLRPCKPSGRPASHDF